MGELTQGLIVEKVAAGTPVPYLANRVALFNPDGTPFTGAPAFKQLPAMKNLTGDTVPVAVVNELLEAMRQSGMMAAS